MLQGAEAVSLYVITNSKGLYLNPRSGGFDPDFDPFRHLFRDIKVAKHKMDSYSYGNGRLTIQEVSLAITLHPIKRP